ncbi:hypothetical protein Aple_068190 [Acrocarpospora pleiomorpha]|uniref:AAA+ ATPase domain-containing protein n=1 Tax=Acrocarpospora pleiomorpha TaxID=90975 RepID=A0A5M3XSW1_9ACTN|nr:hypothetical protein [Acrocarpospora pleiomorpha]GES23920.1 hypothetical protein Aple_068190 [Acrocarpospora pleiomorpha]
MNEIDPPPKDPDPDKPEPDKPDSDKRGSDEPRLEAEKGESSRQDEQLAQEIRERLLRLEGLSRLYPESVGAAAFGDGTAIKNQFNVPQGGRIYHADGDITFGPTAQEQRPEPIPLTEDELARLDPEYLVVTDTLTTLVEAMRPGRVYGLAGPPGSGRTTLARAALARFGTRPQVVTLPGGTDPRRLRLADAKAETGYLIDAGDADWTRSKNQAVFQHLTHLATQAKCVFVVLLDERAHLTPVQRSTYVVSHLAPHAIRVFERCLAYGLRDQGRFEADRQARRLAEHQRIREELDSDTRPREAYALAMSVLKRLRQGRDLDEVINEVCDERPFRLRERAQSLLAPGGPAVSADKDLWSQARESIYRRSFLLALAVLDGKSMVTITAAALRLAKKVDAERESPASAETTWSAFDETLSGWLEYAHAEDDHVKDDHQDEGAERRIRLRVPALVPVILDVAWHNHPTVRGPLIDWLSDLTQDDDTQVRIAAAQAIGKLAGYDYTAIDEEFIQPWARAYRVAGHRLAAWALETAALEARSAAPRVRKRLRTWARGTLPQRSVAVRAYATSLGLMDIGDTLSGLRGIAGTAHADLRTQAARAMAELALSGVHREIVRELADWTRAGNTGLRVAAVEAMLRLAVATLDHEPDRPLLLGMLVEGEARVRAEIAQLWRNALADQRGRAWPSFGMWARHADTDPELIPLLGDLVAGLGADPRLRRALRFYLSWWRDRVISAATANTFLAYLDRRSP